MKNFDTRAYSINDFLEWSNSGQLELSPRFQRRSVWTDNARSYLMDTIIRGKPIPKIFIRQKINPLTKASIREVVDGQQRLRTILSYLKDGFQINKKHNTHFGGLYFSQLESVDDQIQTSLLNYELSVDLLINMPDSEILDVFGRLNSYAVVLNDQERINADHFGPFKTLADRLAHAFFEFWTSNRVLTEAQVMRMGDVTLTADLLIAMIEGIRSKKQLKQFYTQYEKEFTADIDTVEMQFRSTMEDIGRTFTEASLKSSEFHRVPLFYSLFTSLYHLRWGLKNFDRPSLAHDQWNYSRIRTSLDDVEQVILTEEKRALEPVPARFLEDTRLATTDAAVRVRRTQFIVDMILR